MVQLMYYGIDELLRSRKTVVEVSGADRRACFTDLRTLRRVGTGQAPATVRLSSLDAAARKSL
jgi:hypothetical protein